MKKKLLLLLNEFVRPTNWNSRYIPERDDSHIHDMKEELEKKKREKKLSTVARENTKNRIAVIFMRFITSRLRNASNAVHAAYSAP